MSAPVSNVFTGDSFGDQADQQAKHRSTTVEALHPLQLFAEELLGGTAGEPGADRFFLDKPRPI
jgi:hypothetical protein